MSIKFVENNRMKCRLKISRPDSRPRFKISTDYNSAWICGGNCGFALYFPKRLNKVISWTK